MSAKQSEAWPTIDRESDRQSERDRERDIVGEKKWDAGVWAALWLTATQQLIRTLNKPHTCGRTGRMMIGLRRGWAGGVYVVD